MKWGIIQPLTGGMYIGAMSAIGHSAEWILSYPGLNGYKTNKNGEKTSVGNEYHLTEWLKKHNQSVPYYTFDRKMFQPDYNMSPTIYNENGEVSVPNYSDMDIVLAVPVCSGLSMVTSGSQDTKDSRNCNMLYLAKYTMSVIKPKIYIFENAPTLMGARGDEIRSELEKVAKENKYSVLYYKTDTVLHDNCQVRPRTFVIFQRWQGDEPQLPVNYSFEKNTADLIEYLNRIPSDATQQMPIKMSALNICLLEYAKQKHGEHWRTLSHKRPIIDIVSNNEYNEFIDFVEKASYISEAEKTKVIKLIRHAEYKKSLGLNFMSVDIYIPATTVPSIQFKCIQSIIHPNKDRLLTIRECLHFMGMPHDFELLGSIESNYAQIGQNVPARTAEFIVKEAVKIINNWDENREFGDKNVYINNINQTIELV